MTQKLIILKKNYYTYLDRKARHLAYSLSKSKNTTKLLLNYIVELYKSENNLKALYRNRKFESAYHNPISSDLEFVVSRVLYHYSALKNLNWKIYLRRQVGKTAPDIRIEKNNKTIAIIEIKAKAGWIQYFFSSERFKKESKKFREGKSKIHPKELLKRVKSQFQKYYKEFNIKPSQVFVFLPTLVLVHRKRSSLQIKDYDKEFAKNSGLPKSNLILLSNNLLLDLGSEPSGEEYKPTRRFEEFIASLGQMG